MKVVIVIPYIEGTEEQIKKTVKIHQMRAGVPVTVYPVKDSDKEGWVKMHNLSSTVLDYDYYVYSATDYFPGRGFVKKALDKMKEKGVGMAGFNDGKWDGTNATAGILSKEFLKSNYEGGTIFYPGYRMYGADPDLTELAILKKQYVYVPEAILMEIDYEKTGGSYDKEDNELFFKRRALSFPRE